MRTRFAPHVLLLTMLTAAAADAQPAPADCATAAACTQLALEARDAGRYETFHDLAWRAMQTGRPDDPAAMYLLARAQALSGRRRDALIMLRRLADAGVATNAATDEDLRRVRELPGWREVEARFASLASSGGPAAPSGAAVARPQAAPSAPSAAPAAAPAPAPVTRAPAPVTPATPSPAVTPPAPAAPPVERTPEPVRAPDTTRDARAVPPPAAAPAPSPAPSAAAAPRAPVVASPAAPAPPPAAAPSAAAAPPVRATLALEPASIDDAARFATGPFVPAGLAWDAVSRRFLFGDAQARRLFVAGEGSGRTVDLVRAETAGFDSVGALAIDPRRGALWIASTAPDGSGAVHELQLISGRAVRAFRVPDAIGSVRLTDLDVAGDGTVVVLDQLAPSVLVLRPGSAALELLVTLPAGAPASVAIAEHARTAYVAHPGGLLRIDVAAKTVAAVKAPGDLGLQGFERIRAHRNALVAVQAGGDRPRRIVRLRLDTGGRSVTGGSVLEEETPAFPDSAYLTIVGDEAFYLAARPDSGSMTVVVRKVRLPDR